MKNQDKVTPDDHLVYLTKLTPTQLAEQLRNNISVPNESETFSETLKSGFYFKGTVSENSFYIITKDKHEYILRGEFFEESDYTKVEVVFEYDNLMSKKWHKILLIVTGVLSVVLGNFIFLGKGGYLWIVFTLLIMVFFTLLFPNSNQKLVISSHKKRLGKFLNAYEFKEKRN